MTECIFCKIAQGAVPSHKIWEDEKHLAFLTIFPNTEGFSVVISKEHNPSYIFANADEVITGITHAAKEVALKLDRAFNDVGRTGLIFEGMGGGPPSRKAFPNAWHENGRVAPAQKCSRQVLCALRRIHVDTRLRSCGRHSARCARRKN